MGIGIRHREDFFKLTGLAVLSRRAVDRDIDRRGSVDLIAVDIRRGIAIGVGVGFKLAVEAGMALASGISTTRSGV
jgi:hypothetical protein